VWRKCWLDGLKFGWDEDRRGILSSVGINSTSLKLEKLFTRVYNSLLVKVQSSAFGLKVRAPGQKKIMTEVTETLL
jgi:hypothetical protein